MEMLLPLLLGGPAFTCDSDSSMTYTCSAWMAGNGATSAWADLSTTLVDIQDVSAATTTGTDDTYTVTCAGIPSYAHVVTAADVAWHNALDPVTFYGGASNTHNLVEGQTLQWGDDIGLAYDGTTPNGDAIGCESGYWWVAICPVDMGRSSQFPVTPQPATEQLWTPTAQIGMLVNGVHIYGWGDLGSYNDEEVWWNVAMKYELYDIDICGQHAAGGDYHDHAYGQCLQEQLGDDGSDKSPIVGFAADGYPVLGYYVSAGVKAQSCWIKRDYSDTSLGGCGDGGRSCILNNPFCLADGTSTASKAGPATDETVTTLSGIDMTADSGSYFEDFYYDVTCTAQGEQYLDEHNGREDATYGYVYHMTEVFPYNIGPTYRGKLLDSSIAVGLTTYVETTTTDSSGSSGDNETSQRP